MRSSLVRMFALSFLVMAGFATVGCKSTDSSASAGETKAVMCEKCKTTWVLPPGNVGRIQAFGPVRQMQCPDCKAIATGYFATGKMDHTCKTCGGEMTPCEMHK